MKRLAFAFLLSLGCAAAGSEEDWAVVESGELVLGVDVRGALEPAQAQSLGPPTVRHTWEFKIARLAAEGSTVQAGDVVLAFDSSELERQLLEKKNDQIAAQAAIAKELSENELELSNEKLALAEAEAKVQKAALKLAQPTDLTASLDLALARLDADLAQKELVFRRERALAARGDRASDLAGLQGRLRRAEERVAELERDIPRMTITAPSAGTVLHVGGNDRKKKQVGDGVWWGEKVVQIAALDRMRAKGEIDEVDVSRVSAGMPVTFRLEAHPDVECRGTIASVAGTVERQSAENPLRIVRVEIEVEDTGELRARPGMRFEGKIETERLPNVVLVDLNAVFTRASGAVAHRRRGLGSETVQLALGRREGHQIEVVAGLSPGDRVALRDLPQLERAQP